MLGPEDLIVEKPVQEVAAKAHDTQGVNLLSLNRPYDAVGRTASISCEPAELHFRGFALGQPMQQVVRIRNDSAQQTRVIVVCPPSSSPFKVVKQTGGGSLAPGLSEQLVVEFTGQQLQHYQDALLLHTEHGGLTVALHAHPASGSPALPKHLDLGQVPLGDTATRQLQLQCFSGVPIDFAVTVVQHNKHFSAAPLSGAIPPYGSAAVVVAFTPTRYSTEVMQLQVQLAEHGAEPMQVLVSGTCKPGLVQQRIVAAAAAGAACAGWDDEAPRGSKQQSQDQAARSPKALSSSPRRRVAGSLTMLPQGLTASQHITQHDVNMLLNQRPGKLQTKDVKAAIIARKQELAVEQQHLQAALDAGMLSGIDPLDQPDIQPGIKEALFQLQLKQADASARHSTGLVSGKAGAHVGSTPPTAEELASMTAARAEVLAGVEARRQAAAVHRLCLELRPSGAVHVLPDPAGSAATAGSQAAAACSSSAPSCYPGLEAFQPQWLLLSESNDWRKWAQVSQHFVHAARLVIYRNRAQARLRKLRTLAARLRGSKDGLAVQVLQDLVVQDSVVQRPGVAPAQLMTPDKVHPTNLPPQASAQACLQHEPVDKGLYADFSALQAQPYQAEFEYVLLGYKPEEPPSLLPYVPLCKDQPLLVGAAEDLPGGLQVGMLPHGLASLAGMEGMPEPLLSNPYPSSSHSSSMQFSTCTTQAWGLEPQSMLRPRVHSHGDSGAEPAGLCTVKGLAAAAAHRGAP